MFHILPYIIDLIKIYKNNELKIENTTTECMRRWIMILKEIRKKAEKYMNRDIRGYFAT